MYAAGRRDPRAAEIAAFAQAFAASVALWWMALADRSQHSEPVT